jgi:SAM-dependent methyltransferase
VAPEYEYIGNELELFAKAERWKSYFRSHLQKYLQGHVLEVGAGLGGTTRIFDQGPFQSWTCLEPDKDLCRQLEQTISQLHQPQRYRQIQGILSILEPTALFDAIIYIDVLEHVEQDGEEAILAARHLKPGGCIVILSPAYQFLYSPFDKRIGHFRRYTRTSLRKITPSGCHVKKAFYLDSVGALASLVNRLFLKASMPTARQISFWDRVLVRLSTLFDPLHFYSFGRSVIVVWQKAL